MLEGEQDVCVAFIMDNTLQKETEKSLSESNERLKGLLNTLPDLVFIINENGQVIDTVTNKATENLVYKGGKGSVAGGYIQEILPENVSQLVMNTIHKTIETKELQKVEYALEFEEGQLWFEGRCAFIGYAHDKKAVLWVARNITEQKMLETQLRESQKMEALGTLSGGIAHEFNNILTTILGFAEISLSELPEKSEVWENVAVIRDSGKRAADLVKKILTFSRMDVGHFIILDPVALIKDAIVMLRATIPANIEVITDISEDCGMIKADFNQLHQALINLATNAVHAVGGINGKIEFCCRKIDSSEFNSLFIDTEKNADIKNYFQLVVRDMGHGIPEKYINKILEPFFTTKEVGKGTGLGLSIVYGIIENHHGKIVVDSREKSDLRHGETTFTLYFPLVENERAQIELVEKENKAKQGKGHILLVEDDKSIVKVYKKYLESLGYRLTICYDGNEAIKIFNENQQKFDLLFTDMAMPRMSGKVLAQEVLKISPDLPVILSSGFSRFISQDEALALGIRKYLQKPIELATLGRIIDNCLNGVD